jgi:hypothetical protein
MRWIDLAPMESRSPVPPRSLHRQCRLFARHGRSPELILSSCVCRGDIRAFTSERLSRQHMVCLQEHIVRVGSKERRYHECYRHSDQVTRSCRSN